ncbi:MAG: helix-turn-helix domain-containing protein [Planctomycetota bacterium]
MGEEEKSSFADKLRGLRRWHRLTQKEMAEGLSLALSTYQRIERGEVEPSRLVLIQLADRLAVTLDYLMRDEAGLRLPGEDEQVMTKNTAQGYKSPQFHIVGHATESRPADADSEGRLVRFRKDGHSREAEKLFFRMMGELGPDMDDEERQSFEAFFARYCEPLEG